jgi:hypothetical protein
VLGLGAGQARHAVGVVERLGAHTEPGERVKRILERDARAGYLVGCRTSRPRAAAAPAGVAMRPDTRIRDRVSWCPGGPRGPFLAQARLEPAALAFDVREGLKVVQGGGRCQARWGALGCETSTACQWPGRLLGRRGALPEEGPPLEAQGHAGAALVALPPTWRPRTPAAGWPRGEAAP